LRGHKFTYLLYLLTCRRQVVDWQWGTSVRTGAYVGDLRPVGLCLAAYIRGLRSGGFCPGAYVLDFWFGSFGLGGLCQGAYVGGLRPGGLYLVVYIRGAYNLGGAYHGMV